MKLSIMPTRDLVHCNGVLCRVWTGVTEKGTPVLAYVASVQVSDGEDLVSEFDGSVFETDAPVRSAS